MLDSGLGGLTVLTALRRVLPEIEVVYFADTANVPYGDRPLAEIAAFGRQIIEHLQRYDPALIIVASGTTCAAFAESAWTKPEDTPQLGVVACGVDAAVPKSSNDRIGVIATAGTISSGIFERKLKQVKADLRVTRVAAPKLVPLVESCAWASDEARYAVEGYCQPFRAAQCDTVILGCTHFPHLMRWFERSLGSDVTIVDPAIACAQAAAEMIGGRLDGRPLQSPRRDGGKLTFEVSGDPEKFARAAFDLAGVRATTIRRVDFAGASKLAPPQ
jgi:glutamate racemase